MARKEKRLGSKERGKAFHKDKADAGGGRPRHGLRRWDQRREEQGLTKMQGEMSKYCEKAS